MKRTYLLLLVPIFFLTLLLILQIVRLVNSSTTIIPTPTPSATPAVTTPVASTGTPTPMLTETVTATPNPTYTTAPAEITRGNTSKKQMIFTFDCGSSDRSGQEILNVAASHGVKVTFFVTGRFIESNRSLVEAMAAGGHEIYNHSYSHPHFPQLTDAQIIDELQRTENLVLSATGHSSKPYFRLPYGDHGNPPSRVWNTAWSQGYRSIFWTVDALDWNEGKVWNGNTVDATFVKNRIYANAKNGAIVLMHVGDNITGDILDEVFTKLEADGYALVSLSAGL